MRYPYVLLDAGETLFAPRESFAATYARILAQLGLVQPLEVFEAALVGAWEEMSGMVPSGIDRYGHFPGGEDEYWLRFAGRAIARANGGSPTPSFVRLAVDRLRSEFRRLEAWTVFPEVEATLTLLRADGARLGVVSNWDSRLEPLLEGLGLASHFDAIVVSCRVGFEKPSPRIFEEALRRLGATARSTLHVGDVPALDVAGADAAGIDAILVDRRDKHPRHARRLKDLSSLPELAREGIAKPEATP